MDRLWAPWRMNYIKAKKQKGCLFCKANRQKAAGEKYYVIFKSRHSIAMLNSFPYNNGHLMVSPLRHVSKLTQLNENESLDLLCSIDRAIRLLDKVLKPQGYNIGINISRSAGAGITGHLHMHIVPRWPGDTNFMPALYDTRVIPESLDELYRQLKAKNNE